MVCHSERDSHTQCVAAGFQRRVSFRERDSALEARRSERLWVNPLRMTTMGTPAFGTAGRGYGASEAKMTFGILKGQAEFRLKRRLGKRTPSLLELFERSTDGLLRLMR